MFVKDAFLDTTPKGVCLKIQSSNNIVQEVGVQHFLFWKVGIQHLFHSVIPNLSMLISVLLPQQYIFFHISKISEIVQNYDHIRKCVQVPAVFKSFSVLHSILPL